jgi:hypothetical protein
VLDTYENIIIGNFLFGFGVEMGLNARTEFPPTCCNLLQQQPYDKPLGDLLVFNSRFFRLIEFKRATNDSEKEESKLVELTRAMSASSMQHLEAMSRKIHWFVKSDTRKGLETWIVPYLDFPELDQPGGVPTTDLGKYARDTARDAFASARLDDHEVEQCRLYLHLLAHCQKTPAAASGALFLQVVAGQIEYVAVPNLSDILLSPARIMERVAMREREMTMESEGIRERQREHNLEREGPHLGGGMGR